MTDMTDMTDKTGTHDTHGTAGTSPFDALLRRATRSSVDLTIDGQSHTFAVAAWTHGVDQIASAAFGIPDKPRPVRQPNGKLDTDGAAMAEWESAVALAGERRIGAVAAALIGFPVTLPDDPSFGPHAGQTVGFGDVWAGKDRSVCMVEYMRLVEPVASSVLTSEDVGAILNAGKTAADPSRIRGELGNSSAPLTTDQPASAGGSARSDGSEPGSTGSSRSASGSDTSPSPRTASES